MDRPPTRKETSHRRIVEAASRALRRDGFAAVGVADVMREAGLTHGGFYAHFPSRDALLAEAIDHAGRSAGKALSMRADAVRARGGNVFEALVDGYLAESLLTDVDAGCPVAALGADIPRLPADVRAASTTAVHALIRHVERVLPPSSAADAPLVAATLVGSLQLARAMDDRAAGAGLLASARRALIDRYTR